MTSLEVAAEHKIAALEASMLKMPQVECPVIHRFGPGIYIREVFMPRGALVIGHYHRQAHMNIMLTGKLDILLDGGPPQTLTAPMSFVAKPGRKVAYIHEDVVWQNIYATEETDIEKIENMFLIQTDVWYDTSIQRKVEDLKLLNSGEPVPEKTVDYVPLPFGDYKFKAGPCPINGKGIFATGSMAAGEIIGPVMISGQKTILGAYITGLDSPNAIIRGDLLIATKPIKGCVGGFDGDRITVSMEDMICLELQQQQH